MHSQEQTGNAEECKHCSERLVSGCVIESVNALSAVPSHLTAQVTDGVWNAVVTTAVKGTFLIRRTKSLPATACPLQAYEIRCIPTDPAPPLEGKE
jgi:hypothetical protein